MKIFEKIDSINLSDVEEDRIEKCLMDNQSLQFRVLTTKAPAIREHDFWRRAQKTFRVTGFRDGHPKAIQMVLTRALDAQKSRTALGPHAGWHFLGPLYDRSVRLYLHDEIPNLHALLSSEDFNESPGTLTEQILRCIVKCLPLYEVTLDQVRELYELWGFERTEHINEILANVPVEAAAVRRMIADGIGTTRREIASAIATARSDLLRHVEQQQADVASVKNSLQKTQNELDRAIARLESNITAPGAPAKGQPTASTAKKRNSALVHVTGHQPGTERAFAAIAALQTRVEGLGKQLKELRKRLELLQPSHAPTATSKAIRLSTTTALQTINKWSKVFQEVGVPSASIGSSWILLEIVRRSRVILTDKPQLLLGLINALPEGESRCVVASPLWISEADWKDALTFISNDVGVPRVLVISDFDVALQEAYLVPALTAWMGSLRPQNANRVVLVPSDSELVAVSPRVFELAALVTHSAPYIRDIKRLGETIAHAPPTLEFPQSGATIIGYTRETNVSFEDQLKQYTANYGVSVPPRVLEHFVNLYEGLRASLSARDAGYIAQQATLIPWSQHARGEAVSRTLQEALKMVLDGD